MTKPAPRQVTVIRSQRLTPNMQRITLSGESLQGFPEGMESGYIKLLFPLPGETELPSAADMAAGMRPQMRTYTIRAFDAAKQELIVDFVLHGDGDHAGPASNWAREVKAGEDILMAGPGPIKLVDMNADWFLLAGDMTALPAISCNLEVMPAMAKGHAVIEINSDRDKQDLSKPEGIQVHWMTNAHSDQENTFLSDAVKSIPWLNGKPSIWAACEFSNMRLLRKYFKQERSVQRDELYVSSYWKMGHTEDEHKIAKQKDAEAEGN